MARIWPLLALVLVSGCSARWHVNQAIKKGLKVGIDTVYTDRVVITPGDSTTIFVPVTRLKDSLITVYQDRIKIQYRLKHDTIRFNVECDPDSILVRVPIAVNTEINCPPPKTAWRTVSFVLIGLLCLLIFLSSKR